MIGDFHLAYGEAEKGGSSNTSYAKVVSIKYQPSLNLLSDRNTSFAVDYYQNADAPLKNNNIGTERYQVAIHMDAFDSNNNTSSLLNNGLLRNSRITLGYEEHDSNESGTPGSRVESYRAGIYNKTGLVSWSLGILDRKTNLIGAAKETDSNGDSSGTHLGLVTKLSVDF